MPQAKNKQRRVARKTFKNAKASGMSTQKAAAQAGKAAHHVRQGKRKGS